MPILRPSPPCSAQHWTQTALGAALCTTEDAWVRAQLQRVPDCTWLWWSVTVPAPLQAEAPGCWRAGTAASLPLAMPAGSAGRVIVQHVADEHAAPAAVLAECARLLDDGGRLWLFGLHARSPARRDWPGAAAATPATWRRRLHAAGLVPTGRAVPIGTADAGGLRWPLPLAFGLARHPAFVIEAEKRRMPITPLPQRPTPTFGMAGAAGA